MATTTSNTGRDSDKFMLRFPEGMRDRISEAAKANGRTMNAEIVHRLEKSFAAEQPASAQTLAANVNQQNRIDRLMKSLPVDLSTQYGLHLYRSELDRAYEQLTAARAKATQYHADLQEIHADEKSSPGAKAHHSKLAKEASKHCRELEQQIQSLEQTIGAIHEFRKYNGLPELRNVVSISTMVHTS